MSVLRWSFHFNRVVNRTMQIHMLRVACAPLIVTLFLTSCGSDEITDPPLPPPVDPQPTFHESVVSENPINTLSAKVEINASLFDSAFVRYWQAGGQVGVTPHFPFGSDTSVVVPVLGLDTASSYFLETNLVVAGIAAPFDTATFSSGSLPTWIPNAVAVGTDTTPGFLALSYPDGPVIVDNTGRVVWYASLPNGVLNSFQAHEDGSYTILGARDSVGLFRVLNDLGEEIGQIGCVGFETRFHDLRILAESDYWISCNDTRTMDLSSMGGVDTAQVTATVIQHVSPNGALLFEWKAFDHFAITDLELGGRIGPNVNFTHGNGIEFDADGNLLLSFRSLNEITKVNATTGDVMWRFGGIRNQFTLVNDSKGSFEQQHGLRRSGPGQIQFLDNANGPPSRFVRYLIDEATMTATLVLDFRDAPDTWTTVGGSTQYYDNGHGLVSFGRAGRVVEVDAAGNRAWELTGIDSVYVFRAQRINSLYRR